MGDAMTSVLDICLMALDHIGASSIASLEEKSAEARACRRFFYTTRDQVLRDHAWGFAERRKFLTMLNPDHSYGFDYAYEYPQDCLSAREIFRSPLDLPPIEFRVVRQDDGFPRMILCNEPSAILIYTAKISDCDGFDSAFIKALSWALAAELAMPLTKTLNVQEAALKVYAYHINMAGRCDTMEMHQDPVNHFNSFLEARK